MTTGDSKQYQSKNPKKLQTIDSKDVLQDPNVRLEAIAGTNLFGFKPTK